MTRESDNPQPLPEPQPAPRSRALAEVAIALLYTAFFGTIGWAVGRLGDQGGRRTAQYFLGAVGGLSGLFIRAHVVLKEKDTLPQAQRASMPGPADEPAEVKAESAPSPQVEAKSIAAEQVVHAKEPSASVQPA